LLLREFHRIATSTTPSSSALKIPDFSGPNPFMRLLLAILGPRPTDHFGDTAASS
jgi:hypothetical protein